MLRVLNLFQQLNARSGGRTPVFVVHERKKV
jgi:hypothetical protein